MKALIVFFSICVGALAAGPSIAEPLAVADRPTIRQGDEFEYADRFGSVSCKRWSVTDVQAGGGMVMRCGDNKAFFTADGALVKILGPSDKELVKFSPHALPIPFPLHVGSKWDGSFKVFMSSQIVAPKVRETCEVTGYETVEVPAGALPAFHIACTDAWSVGILSGTSTSSHWYAPDAKTMGIPKAISRARRNSDMPMDNSGGMPNSAPIPA